MCGAKGHVRFAPNSDREVLHRPLIPAIHIGCSPIASTDPARLCVRSTTYTEIYRCISHGAEGSALVFWDVGKSPHWNAGRHRDCYLVRGCGVGFRQSRVAAFRDRAI